MSEDPVLLVPTASKVPQQLRLDVGNIPTGLIPLKGRPVISHISDNYSSETKKYAAFLSEDYEKNSKRIPSEWNIIKLQNTNSLAETVSLSLDRMPDKHVEDSRLFINFADTLISPTKGGRDQIYFDKEEYTSRWTSFETDGNKTISIKPKHSGPSKEAKNVFTGLFKINAPQDLSHVLQEKLEDDARPFYRGLKKYMQGRNYRLIEASDWQDVGHLDTYYEAKKSLLNSREFNEVKVKHGNTLTKKSRDKEKLRPELEWYSGVPSDIKPFTPRIYSSKETENELQVKMEYIGYPALSDLFLFGNHSAHVWKNIYSKLFGIVERFHEYKPEQDRTEYLEDMYINKTRKRVEKVKNNQLDSFMRAETVKINGEEYRGMPYIKKHLEEVLRENNVLETSRTGLVHGDFHFSNILYGPRFGQMKAVDPRGKFGGWRIYGDQAYDLAKLRHSAVGGYDFIINDMFEASVNGSQASYQVQTEQKHLVRENLFDKMLRTRYSQIYQKIKIVESLLFLSMVPLHAKSSERQKYMISHGIKQFNEAALKQTSV